MIQESILSSDRYKSLSRVNMTSTEYVGNPEDEGYYHDRVIADTGRITDKGKPEILAELTGKMASGGGEQSFVMGMGAFLIDAEAPKRSVVVGGSSVWGSRSCPYYNDRFDIIELRDRAFAVSSEQNENGILIGMNMAVRDSYGNALTCDCNTGTRELFGIKGGVSTKNGYTTNFDVFKTIEDYDGDTIPIITHDGVTIGHLFDHKAATCYLNVLSVYGYQITGEEVDGHIINKVLYELGYEYMNLVWHIMFDEAFNAEYSKIQKDIEIVRFEKILKEDKIRRLAEIDANIASAEGALPIHLKNYVQVADKIVRFLKEKEELEAEIAQSCNVAEMLKAIKDIPLVASVELKGHNIIVYTDYMTVKDRHDGRDYEYDLGLMTITIDTKNYSVVFGNRTRLYDNSGFSGKTPAPHVSSHGQACWGSVAPAIPELFSQRDYPQLIEIAINFLQVVNTSDSAGKSVLNGHYPVLKIDGVSQIKDPREKPKVVPPEPPRTTPSNPQIRHCYKCGVSEEDAELDICVDCSEPVCEDCSHVCTDCGDVICDDCVVWDDGEPLCQSCYDSRYAEEE